MNKYKVHVHRNVQEYGTIEVEASTFDSAYKAALEFAKKCEENPMDYRVGCVFSPLTEWVVESIDVEEGNE